MKTLESLKSFGRKAFVGGLVLSGLATGCSTTPSIRIEIDEQINKNLNVKYITIDERLDTDRHILIVSDSLNNDIVRVEIKGEPDQISVYGRDKTTIKENCKKVYTLKY